MRMVLRDGIERVLHRITTLIVEARDDGSLPPGPEPEALAQVLYQMWLGAALLAKLTRSHMPMQRAMVATKIYTVPGAMPLITFRIPYG